MWRQVTRYIGVPSFGFREGFYEKFRFLNSPEAEKLLGIQAEKCEFRVRFDGFGAV
jgi:hypothetical protein